MIEIDWASGSIDWEMTGNWALKRKKEKAEKKERKTRNKT